MSAHIGSEIIQYGERVEFDRSVYGEGSGTGEVVARNFFGDYVSSYEVRVDGLSINGGFVPGGRTVVTYDAIRRLP